MGRPIYESKTIDYETGEIKTEYSVSRATEEPRYVKFYLQTLCMLNDVPQTNNKLLYGLLKRVSYANSSDKDGGQTIYLNSALKEEICKEAGLTMASLNKAIYYFVKTGLFKRIKRGTLQANPAFFGKGDWKEIKQIKAVIDYNNEEIKPIFK